MKLVQISEHALGIPQTPTDRLLLVIDQVRDEAPGIRSYLLRAAHGGRLPAFTAGAHIDVHLPDGLKRSYSIWTDPRDTDRYGIAVARAANSRGGSAFICDAWDAGDIVETSLPRNTFPLAADAGRTVLVAGGIGITPILSMIAVLQARGADWRLVYAARSRQQLAFQSLLKGYGQRVRFHADDEAGCVLDLARVVTATPCDAHLYCCGPTSMLASFQALCIDRDPDHVHIEHFTGATPSGGRAFRIILARSGRMLAVGPHESILEVLLNAGLDVPYSCSQGTCGECRTSVLQGVPDHRDVVLNRRQRAENKTMMICCSRAQTDSITLDL